LRSTRLVVMLLAGLLIVPIVVVFIWDTSRFVNNIDLSSLLVLSLRTSGVVM
jgi:hypothetical protein